MFQVCKKERIDYISYGKFARYTLSFLPFGRSIPKMSPYFINSIIVFTLIVQMAYCVNEGNRIIGSFLNSTYGIDPSYKLPVIVMSIPYFLTTMTVPKLPSLVVFGIIGVTSLVTIIVLNIVYCVFDMSVYKDVHFNLFGSFSNIPELVTCLIMGMGCFPVVSINDTIYKVQI